MSNSTNENDIIVDSSGTHTCKCLIFLLLLQLSLLKKHLKVSSSDKALSANLLGTGLSHAFLKAMVCLLGKSVFLSHCMQAYV